MAAKVSQCQSCSSHADFPGFSLLCDLLVIFVQKEHMLIGKGSADRNALCVIPSADNAVIRTIAGDLGRSVQIDKFSIRQMIHPDFQMLIRHDLPAEKYSLHTFGGTVIQSVECADQAKRGHSPDHGSDFMFADIIQKLRRPGKQLFWYDHQRGCRF